jgi:hypothetical protein
MFMEGGDQALTIQNCKCDWMIGINYVYDYKERWYNQLQILANMSDLWEEVSIGV